MRKVILYSAISIDGMIAKEDGSVDWLDELPNPDKLDYGYFDFYKKIDTTIMGNKTYQQVLGFDVPFPYPDKENFVLTRNSALQADENVQFISKDPVSFVHELKSKEGADIWLIGGGAINALFLNNNLVDELKLSIIPVVLGNGIPLFNGPVDLSKFQFLESKAYNTGVVSLVYQAKVEMA